MKVLVLGYSRNLSGGVARVTDALLNNMPELELHSILFCYSPKLKSILLTSLSFLKYLLKLIFRKREYCLIHVIVGSSGDAGVEVCIQFHKSADIIRAGIKSDPVLRYIKKIWRSVDIMAFLSQRLLTIHEDYFDKVKNPVIISNALENKWLEVSVLPLNNRNRDIVFFGRWSWEKGVNDLVAAMEKVKFKGNCALYTDAPANLSYPKCEFFQWVNEAQVREIISAAKLLVLPSYSEAYPTVLLEAAACGTPFVATNIAGIPDIIKESQAGLMVNAGDFENLARQIDKILLDTELWSAMSRSGKLWSNNLNIENITDQWRKVYLSAC